MSQSQMIADQVADSREASSRTGFEGRKLKVVIVTHSLPRAGGAEQVLYDLMTGLSQLSIEPVLCCLYELGELGERLRSEGHRTLEHVALGRVDPRNVLAIKKVLVRERADILYVIDAFHNVVVGRLAAMLVGDTKTVIAFHNFDTVRAKIQRTPFLRRLVETTADRLLHPLFHRVIALAESHKRYLAETKRISPEKISVIHNGIDHQRFMIDVSKQDARRQFDLPPDKPIVGIVASLNLYKSHDQFLMTAAEIKKLHPETLFVVAGRGPERENLERMARDLGISDRVLFLGQVKDVPTLLRALDVSVLTSFHEAFPLALLESMAAELPVVSSDVGSVDAIVLEGVNGYRVNFGESKLFADRVVRLLKDPELAKRFGAAGREMVQQKFTLDRMARQTESVFHELVEKGKSDVQ